MNNNYQKQLKATELLINTLPWHEEAFFCQFMAQTYFFVCHSTRLLARSLSHFGVDRDFLYKRFVAHLKEESYHEKIAVSDLAAFGFKPSDFEEFAITKAFWESQYYKIDHSKGTSLLGYILFLEAIPVYCFNGAIKNVPQKSYKFIKVHMEEDPAHLNHVLGLIEELSPTEQIEVWKNYHQTAELYQMMLSKIEEKTRMLSKVA